MFRHYLGCFILDAIIAPKHLRMPTLFPGHSLPAFI